MMFFWTRRHKLEGEVEYLRSEISRLKEKIYELERDFVRLTEALGLSKETINTVRYVRKGGPERPS